MENLVITGNLKAGKSSWTSGQCAKAFQLLRQFWTNCSNTHADFVRFVAASFLHPALPK